MQKFGLFWLVGKEKLKRVGNYLLLVKCYTEIVNCVQFQLVKSSLKVQQLFKLCHYIIFDYDVRFQCNKDIWEKKL